MSEVLQNSFSPSLEKYIKNSQTTKQTNIISTPIKNEPQDTFVSSKESKVPYRDTKEGLFVDFALKVALVGTTFLLGAKYFDKILHPKVKQQVVNIWEDIRGAKSLSDMSLPDELSKLASGIKRNVDNPQEIQEKGGELINAVLLYGPPGTGKTTFAKALAKEMGVSGFANLDVTNLGSKYVGETEKNIQSAVERICKVARENPDKKFAVFIDEIDSVIMVDNGNSAKYSNDVLNEFKRCITERLGKQKNIITIGATNIDIAVPSGQVGEKSLDNAMLSRLGKKVKVDLPNAKQLEEQISKHYKNAPKVSNDLKSGEKLETLCKFMAELKNDGRGVSFRTLNTLYAEAANLTKKDEKVQLKHFIEALKLQQEELGFNNKQIEDLSASLGIIKQFN